eukprot:15451593-Alexandrium_andersonii.AAC.1
MVAWTCRCMGGCVGGCTAAWVRGCVVARMSTLVEMCGRCAQPADVMVACRPAVSSNHDPDDGTAGA